MSKVKGSSPLFSAICLRISMCKGFRIFHKWSKWESFLQNAIYVIPGASNIEYKKDKLRRECLKCGMKEIISIGD